VRIYRNGHNTGRVLYEHAVLRALQAKAASLPFEVPHALVKRPHASSVHDALRHMKDHEHATFHIMKSGAATSVFKLIPGGPPTVAHAQAIGMATAQLVKALADVVISPSIKPVNPLYRNLYDAHHTVTKALFHARVHAEDFAAVRAPMDALLGRFADAEALIDVILSGGGLPEQVINADLHSDNVLCEGDAVSGVLDFEFAARDWRVMECVVGLSKYAGLASPMAPMREYMRGYALGGGSLPRREVELIPRLIVLRVLNNIVYFVGRAIAGEDSIEPITGRAQIYAKRCDWLIHHNDELVNHFLAEEGLVRD
jgi:homoserine kinase type II